MLRRFNRGLALLVAVIGCALAGSPAVAGWGHGWGHRHHHHHHHGLGYGLGYGGLYSSWGYPSYGTNYTSLSIGFPRYYSGYTPYYGVGGYGVGGYGLGGYGLGGYGLGGYGLGGYGLGGYGLGGFQLNGYRSFHTPRVLSYSVSLPSYYAAPETYYAPSYSSYAPDYYAPTYPSYPGVCDPCVSYPACGSSSIGYPSSNYNYAPSVDAPVVAPDSYSTGVVPQPSTKSPLLASARSSSSVTAGGSFVDRMLGRSSPVNQSLIAQSSTTPSRNLARLVGNQLPARSTDASRPHASVQRVSTTKSIITPDTSIPAFDTQLTPMPAGLLEAADAIFAAGGYSQAASAYARLTVRYGNHDELAVRRFIALVASGDCAQAAVVFQLAGASSQVLSNKALPAGGLTSLYGANADVRKSHIDMLADFAMKQADDSLPLTMVGTWLILDGQPERAELFLKRASGQAPKSNSLVVTPEIAARLVAAELAR